MRAGTAAELFPYGRLQPYIVKDGAQYLKRGQDLVLSLVLLIMLAPVLGMLAILVWLSGPGPVIYRQLRIGAGGQPFTLLKFRTMRHDPGAPFEQARPGDERATPVGRWLRRFSLDELLQLVNVLRGEMSLVGPRPHAPETTVEGVRFDAALALYPLRYRVRPGMTGLAQIRGQRGETRHLRALESRLASDLEYIQNWSWGLDAAILLQTLPVLVGQGGAV